MRSAERIAGEFPPLAAGRIEPARPASNGGGAARFDALYQELNREVMRYIEQGDGGSASQLSPVGAWGRMQSMPAPGGDAGVDSGVDSGVISGVIGGGVEGAQGVRDAQRQAFIDEVLPLARGAGAKLGVAPEVLTAQAALETGWGRSPIRGADGAPSHNYFGIKATGWQGAVARVMTAEVEGGQAVARQEAFRAYASPAQSFDDLAALIGKSPRYQGALQAGADARAYGAALQRGGYATDPAYAEKLAKVASAVAARAQGAAK
jgi:flagellar protein FlgJ